MIILDENIIAPERARLRAWRIHFRVIGLDVGHFGMKDQEEIIPLLHGLRHPTFFTRDEDFYHPSLRHRGYCLVYLDVDFDQVADFVRRFLRHSAFRISARRMGTVVRIRQSRLSYWQVGREVEHMLGW